MSETNVLAFDFGASTGRAIVCTFDGEQLTLTQVHRFPNEPFTEKGTLYWNFPLLFEHVKQGMVAACRDFEIESMAVDTWGVDFGLLKDGELLEYPVHYRDQRTQGILNEAFEIISRGKIYELTGIQIMEINSLFQLLSLAKNRPELLNKADTLLFMPDLFVKMLTGARNAEYTIASTSQIMTPKGEWACEALSAMGIPEHIFPEIVDAGTEAGVLSAKLQKELNLPAIKVLYATGHDTAAAVVGCPADTEDFAYISSGTWSLMGTESRGAIINENSYASNFTNEGGYAKTTRFLKNIMGLWLIQESIRQWKREGEVVDFVQLMREAMEAPAFVSFIDPDAGMFAPPGDMPGRVREFCRQTGQQVPRTRGELVRTIYESLALTYKRTFEQMQKITGINYPRLHIIGGGSNDVVLSQFTADALGVEVLCGPTEATAIGNALVQMLSLGKIKNIEQARKVVRASNELKRYEPKGSDGWTAAEARFEKILESKF